MKFSTRTINILKSFSQINQSILFKPGTTVDTIAQSKKIMASAQVDEVFEQEFGIYDLPRLLSAISLFKDPEITLHDKNLVVSGEGKQVSYTYAHPETIASPPEKGIVLPSEDASFKLPGSILQQALKAAGVLGSSDLAFVAGDSGISIQAFDAKNPTSHAFSAILDPDPKPILRMVFKVETFKFLPADYDVVVSLKKIARFVGDGVTYFVAAESAS